MDHVLSVNRYVFLLSFISGKNPRPAVFVCSHTHFEAAASVFE
jgi:hypothetical protein